MFRADKNGRNKEGRGLEEEEEEPIKVGKKQEELGGISVYTRNYSLFSHSLSL